MKIIMNVMESLVTMNGWTVERFDIQRKEILGSELYTGFLTVKETAINDIMIREDGTFEFMDK